MELVFDTKSEDQFPPLPAKGIESTCQTASSTTTPHITALDIEASIAKALEDQERKFQQQLDQLVERNNALEDSLQILTDKLNDTIASIIDKTVAAMVGPTSPFFTKVEATKMMEQQQQLQEQTQSQFEKILKLLSNTSDKEHPVTQSPHRKNQRTEEVRTPVTCTATRNDQIMTEARHDEVGPN